MVRIVVPLFFPHDFGNLVVVCGLNLRERIYSPSGD
nr:MAG TPA: hypothetical protein [Caudoviricetes sp.]